MWNPSLVKIVGTVSKPLSSPSLSLLGSWVGRGLGLAREPTLNRGKRGKRFGVYRPLNGVKARDTYVVTAHFEHSNAFSH